MEVFYRDRSLIWRRNHTIYGIKKYEENGKYIGEKRQGETCGKRKKDAKVKVRLEEELILTTRGRSSMK